MRKISGVEWGKVLQELLALSLAILICISGIYAVPYGEIPSDSVVEVKRAFYMLAMALMAIHLMRCGSSGLHKLFSVSCVLLMLIFLMNAVIRQETFLESVYNAVSISFVWLFVGSIQG
jgi:hypothetical protein